jgi:hypothetical protein
MTTGTYKTGGPKAGDGNAINASERESLSDYISMISRDDTPFLTSIGKTKAKSVLHEWQTDELDAPGSNARAEGVDFGEVSETAKHRTRLSNSTQILAKTISVSGTKRAVDQAGVKDEFAYQVKKRGTEMRRDLEHTLVHSWQSKNASGTRTMGGVHSFADGDMVWDAVSDTWASDAASNFTNTFNGNGTLTAADAANTEVVIDLSNIDNVQQRVYEEGGKSTRIMVSPKNRRAISAAAQIANTNVRRSIGDSGKLRQSVDIYESDFGEVMIVPNWIMGTGGADAAGPLLTGDNQDDFSAICYDPMWFNVATLRPTHTADVGQKGDSTIGMLVEECTLECKNPKGFGLIVGIGA